MPRQPRLDFPGGFYHIINRGIERRRIFKTTKDYEMFIKTLGRLLQEEGHKCCGWVLMSNHFHLLLERGPKHPLSRLMNRLQTTYVGYYNRKYHRSGRFYQNRYKAILCDKEEYFMELIAYLHLNPLRAGVVKDVEELKKYRWSGHHVLLGHGREKWQNVNEILYRFGKNVDQARKKYLEYLREKSGEKQELSGGGLIRSAGNLKIVLSRKKEDYETYDSRILGGGEFVEKAIRNIEEEVEKEVKPLNIEKYVEQTSAILDVSYELLKKPGKSAKKGIACARGVIVYISVVHQKMNHTQWSLYFQISLAAISKLYKKGEKAVREKPELVSRMMKLTC